MGRFFGIMIDASYWYPCIHLYIVPTSIIFLIVDPIKTWWGSDAKLAPLHLFIPWTQTLV